MTGIIIEAKTPQGKEAMKKVTSLDNDRKDWMKIFKETVSSDEPYTVTLKYRNNLTASVLPVRYLIEVIKKGMARMGVTDEDYEVRSL